MKTHRRLRPGQAAWLAEIGVDTHWLREQPVRPDSAPEAARGTAPERDPAAMAVDPAPIPSGAPTAASALASAPAPTATPAPAPAPGPHQAPSRAPAAPAPSGVAPADCPDLAALAAAVQACARCAQHGQRLRAVPGAGLAHRPRYLIVGEQPGLEDDARGLPFQGDQGRLLDAMLAAVRLPQADASWRTHVVKCRVAGGSEPAAEDIRSCLAWLHREIELLQPQWILALGLVAARAVTGSDADLDALRGGPHRYVSPQGIEIPVWVTHQPASLLVRSAHKAEAWRDLLGFVRAVGAESGADSGTA